MKKRIFLQLFIIFFFGCKKDNSFDYSSGLIGQWSWFSSCCGTTNSVCWGPDSAHPSFDIAFTSPSIFNVYHNGTLSASSRYSTCKVVIEGSKYTICLIKFDTGGPEQYSITNDTLSLVNSDGILTVTSRYKKIDKFQS